MKRPYLLITGAAAAGLLIAGIGASAHTMNLTRMAGAHVSTLANQTSATSTESPEPSDSPEASPTAEPTEQPEAPATAKPSETPETDEQGDNNDDQGEQAQQGAPPASGEHGGGGD